MKLLIVLICAGAPCLASDVHIVKTSKYGAFEFSPVCISNKTFFGSTSCTITGTIINRTDASWSDSEFTVTILGKAKDEKLLLNLKVISIPFGGTVPFSTYCYLPSGQIADYPSFEPESYLIVFEGGGRDPSPETKRKEAAAARAATAAKDKARVEYLSKFPTIQSGFASAFIGSDKKCSAQFLEAAAMEGLEKRKRLAEFSDFLRLHRRKFDTRVG